MGVLQRMRPIVPLLMLGLAAGFLNGLLGAGGGILIVAGLSRLTRGRTVEPRTVFATAIAVMLPLSALSAWRYFRHGSLRQETLFVVLLPAVLGGLLGAWLLLRLSPRFLRLLFGALIAVSGVVMLCR